MKFSPRAFIKTSVQKKNPVQKIDTPNPPMREAAPTVSRATIEPNFVSTVSDPLQKMTRKPRG